jgi:hypothetical protein
MPQLQVERIVILGRILFKSSTVLAIKKMLPALACGWAGMT